MSKFYYVYMLIDTMSETHHYVGYTENLKERLAMHNAGRVPHTAKYKPWRIQTAIALDSKEKAVTLEIYLKTHSGRAFAEKHL